MYLSHILRMLYGEGKLYSPDDDLGTLNTPDELDDTDDKDDDKVDDTDDKVDDDVDDKVEEDDDKDDKDDDTDEEDKDDEETDDDDKEKDEEDEEDDDEDKELDRVSRASEIKTKYPDIFKEFPDLRGVLYRDQQYSELFGSPEDAETAVERSRALGAIEDDLIIKGDPSELLATLSKNNKESYEAISLKTLTYAQEHNRDLYIKLASLPIKQLLRSAWKQGNGTKTDLGKAAAHIHKFFFENMDFNEQVEAEKGLGKKEEGKSKAETEYEKRLAEIDSREYGVFENSVNQSYIRKMDNEIRSVLVKDDRLNDYTRNKLVEDILGDIKKQLEADTRYMNGQQSLWKQAKANKFSNDFKSRIVSAALARAKSLVPEARKRLLAKALGKPSKDKVKDKDTDKRVARPDSKRRESNNNNDNKKPKSDLDIMRS